MARLPSFRDRRDAGARLAGHLLEHARADELRNVTVLGLPRGGVPVAGVVAQRLDAPLDALVVRKIGMPGHEELAVGAVGPAGITLLDEVLLSRADLAPAVLEPAVERARRERDRRELAYREGRAPPDLQDRAVLLVDDGLATGSTMLAAVAAVSSSSPSRVIVAVPVAAPGSVRRLRAVADDVVAVLAPTGFAAVGQWYDDFGEVSDHEVRGWLSGADPG